ncbi:hypothetical protein FRC01_009585 [Tulasnella sp. 417]|nr:hypothetical protein FRC01_009585 [Tulasnella sp. 417]
MPQRTTSCPIPSKTPVAFNAQTTSTNPVSPSQASTSTPMSPQRRANTYPAECPKRRENHGQSTQDGHQDAPYTTTPQAWEAELPDFFAASPDASGWQTTENASGAAVFTNDAAGVTIEMLPMDW